MEVVAVTVEKSGMELDSSPSCDVVLHYVGGGKYVVNSYAHQFRTDNTKSEGEIAALEQKNELEKLVQNLQAEEQYQQNLQTASLQVIAEAKGGTKLLEAVFTKLQRKDIL